MKMIELEKLLTTALQILLMQENLSRKMTLNKRCFMVIDFSLLDYLDELRRDNFMSVFNIIFPAILSLIGVIIGSYITANNQKEIQAINLNDIKNKEYHAILQEQMIVYNEYLRAKITDNIVLRRKESNDYFDFDCYINIYRPIFSDKIHLLDDEVVHWILSIDKYIQTIRLTEGNLNKIIDQEVHQELLIWFANLDGEIMQQLGKYKSNVIDGYYQNE